MIRSSCVARVRGVGQADVRVQRDDPPVRVGAVVRGVELGVAVQRRTGVAAAAEHRLLLVDRDAVPELHQHPDQPHDLVGPTPCPGRFGRVVDPDQAVGGRAGRVRGAVLEAEQVARRAGRAGRRAEAVHLPADLHRPAGVPGDVADGVMDGVRVIAAQLQHQVAVQPRRLERVIGEGRHRGEAPWLGGGEAEPVVEQARAERQGGGQAVGGHGRPEDVAVGRWLPDTQLGHGTAGGEDPGAGR